MTRKPDRPRSEEQKRRNAAGARRRYALDLPESRRISREKVDVVRRERLAMIAGIKLERGCIDCGYREHPAALHFDHRDPRQKSFAIAKSLTCSWPRLLAEIAKCDVRCANCHAVRSVVEGHVGRPRIDINAQMVAAGHAVVYLP